MSVPYIVWAFQQRDLTPARRLVLIALCERANGERVCFPSFPLIAKDCELSERAAYAAVRYLADVRGLIAKVTDRQERADILSRAGARPNTLANIYRIMRPVGKEISPTPANGAGVTPANGAGVWGQTPAQNAGQPLHTVQRTPAHSSGEPSKEPRKRNKPARERAEEGFDSFPIKQASEAEPEDRQPSPAEIAARRIEARAEVAAMPAEARAAISTVKHAMLAPVPRPPKLSWSEQIEGLASRRGLPRPQEPIRTVDEQLAELRRMIAADAVLQRPPLRLLEPAVPG